MRQSQSLNIFDDEAKDLSRLDVGYEVSFFLFFFFSLSFLGPLPRHMEVPRLGVESEL